MPGPRRIGECSRKIESVRIAFDCSHSMRTENQDSFTVDLEDDLPVAPRPSRADDFPVPPRADDGPVATLQVRMDTRSDTFNENSAKLQVREHMSFEQEVTQGSSLQLANDETLNNDDSTDRSARSSWSASKSRRQRLIASVSSRLVRWKPPGLSWRRKAGASNSSIYLQDSISTPVPATRSVEVLTCSRTDTESPSRCMPGCDGVPVEIPLPRAKGLSVGRAVRCHTISHQGVDPPRIPSTTLLEQKTDASQKPKTPRHERDAEQTQTFCNKDVIQHSLAPELGNASYLADVALAVYSLNGASAFNKITEFAGLGGAYHVGLEIFCLEWSYGWCPHGTGVHNVYAGCSDSGTFKERVVLGRTPCRPHEVLTILGELRETWPGTSYNLLHKNCAHFTMEFVERLQVGRFPVWVNSLPSLLRWLTEWIGAPLDQAPVISVVPASDGQKRASKGEADANEAIVASELDWVEAQEYILERAADAELAWHQRRKANR